MWARESPGPEWICIKSSAGYGWTNNLWKRTVPIVKHEADEVPHAGPEGKSD